MLACARVPNAGIIYDFFCIYNIVYVLQKKLYVEFIFDDNNDDDDDKLPGNNSDSHSLCTHAIYNEYIVCYIYYYMICQMYMYCICI